MCCGVRIPIPWTAVELCRNLVFDLTCFRQQIIVYVYSSSSVIAKQSESVILASGKTTFSHYYAVLASIILNVDLLMVASIKAMMYSTFMVKLSTIVYM